MDWKIGLFSGIVSLIVSVGVNLLSELHIRRFDKKLNFNTKVYDQLVIVLDKLLALQNYDVFRNGNADIDLVLESSNRSAEKAIKLFDLNEHLIEKHKKKKCLDLLDERKELYQEYAFHIQNKRDEKENETVIELVKANMNVVLEIRKMIQEQINTILDDIRGM